MGDVTISGGRRRRLIAEAAAERPEGVTPGAWEEIVLHVEARRLEWEAYVAEVGEEEARRRMSEEYFSPEAMEAWRRYGPDGLPRGDAP